MKSGLFSRKTKFFILHPSSLILIILLLAACGEDATPIAATQGNGQATGPVATARPGNGPLVGTDGQITVVAPAATGDNIEGQIFWVKDNTIWQGGAGTAGVPPVSAKELGGKALIKVTPLALAKSPALSPDGTKLAYAYSPEPEGTGGNIVIGQDIYVFDLKSGATGMVIKRDEPQAFLDNPYWSADGKYLYFDARNPRRDQSKTIIGENITINRLELATSKREKLAEDAREPAVLPDGKQVVFVSVAASAGTYDTNLKILDIASGQVKALLTPEQGFVGTYMPRPSPDGKVIAFSAIGGPNDTFSPLQPTPTKQGSLIGSTLGLTALLPTLSKPADRAAHGLPYDLWLIKPNGSDLTRLTTLYEDHTMPAWSNDGKRIAFLTGLAFYLVDADGKNLIKKSDRGGQQAGFVWRNQ